MYDFLAILQVFALREKSELILIVRILSLIQCLGWRGQFCHFLTQKLSIELFKLCPIDSIFWIKIIIFSTEYKKFLPLIKGEPLYPFVDGFFLRWSTFCFYIHYFFMFCIFIIYLFSKSQYYFLYTLKKFCLICCRKRSSFSPTNHATKDQI